MNGQPPTPDEIVGTNIKRLREDRGYSQDHMAESLGRSKGWLSPREKGRKVSPSDMYDICVVLDVTVFDLMLPPPARSRAEMDSESTRILSERRTIWFEHVAVAESTYSETLFGIPSALLVQGQHSAFKWILRLEQFRRDVLAQHPDVRAALALTEEAQEEIVNHRMLDMILAGKERTVGKSGAEIVDPTEAANAYIEEYNLDVSLELLERDHDRLADRWADLREQEDKIVAEGVAVIESRISRGAIPEPGLPKKVPNPLDPTYDTVIRRLRELEEWSSLGPVIDDWLEAVAELEPS
ncbi:MAG: helix-turn-helix domain-containing protein [Actinomycetia bacterium]|nr:helix-turn-helix domain-containing protein [Actinomycetes bacterium]